jgi:hypothetical protein
MSAGKARCAEHLPTGGAEGYKVITKASELIWRQALQDSIKLDRGFTVIDLVAQRSEDLFKARNSSRNATSATNAKLFTKEAARMAMTLIEGRTPLIKSR